MTMPPDGWEARGHPTNWFRRFTFAKYAETRQFLDDLAALSVETGRHPQNLNFATTHANITIEGVDQQEPGEAEHAFALKINALAAPRAGP
jgi:pterin-4a-carbinolamine dehydratase